MIKTELIGTNALKMVAPHKLQASDFLELTPEVDSLIARSGNIRLLIDASQLDGWVNAGAVEKHMQFVIKHQSKVERIALSLSTNGNFGLSPPSETFCIPR